MRTVRRGVDLSDTGAGKTYVAAAVASLLGLPTLVICPTIAVGAWERAAAHFEDTLSVIGYEKLRTGHTPFGTWDNPVRQTSLRLVCEFCQQEVDPGNPRPCYTNPQGIHCLNTKERPHRYGRFHFHPAVKMVIFDEIHRCGALHSLNADMLIAARRQNLFGLGLSATAACNPIGMRALGYFLGLHNLDADLLGDARIGKRIACPSFSRWAHAHGCQRDARFHGWTWHVGKDKQREVMGQIRDSIIPDRGVRISWTEIPNFPKRQILTELYDLDSPEKIDGCYQRMFEATEALKQRSFSDKDPDHPLTKILRARQTVELLKVPVFEQLGFDYLQKGMTVVFFVNFAQTIYELSKLFPKFRIIDGETPGRAESLDLLQTNRIPGLIVNCAAGGICCDMHDLDGAHPRVGLVSLGFSAVTARQVFGRLHRDGATSPALYRVLFANKTVEVPIYRAVKPKLDNLDVFNDGLTDNDLRPENLQIS